MNQSSYQPNASPNKQQRAWTTGSAFDTLGWGPDGNVRGSYSVNTTPTDFVVYGGCDVDGNSSQASYTSSKTLNVTMVSGNNVY